MPARLVLLVLALLCLAPGAGAQNLTTETAQQMLAQRQIAAHPAECARLRRQLDQFTMMFERAGALENEMWAERMQQQITQLRGIQAARCPNDVPVDQMAVAMRELIALAAKGAAAYFTFGATGF